MGLFSKKETAKLEVTGMHCEKCVARVKAALEGVDGVTKAKVELQPGSAEVQGHGFDRDALVPAIEAVGFNATLVAE